MPLQQAHVLNAWTLAIVTIWGVDVGGRVYLATGSHWGTVIAHGETASCNCHELSLYGLPCSMLCCSTSQMFRNNGTGYDWLKFSPNLGCSLQYFLIKPMEWWNANKHVSLKGYCQIWHSLPSRHIPLTLLFIFNEVSPYVHLSLRRSFHFLIIKASIILDG